MKFGYNMHPMMGMGPRGMVAVARKTEELGYESMWMPDHYIFPPVITTIYPPGNTGEPSWRPETPLYDPFVLLSSLAAATTRLRLGVHVLLLPLRDTIATARAVTTLDLFSEGRVSLGVGLGWLKDEYDVSGHSWETRGPTLGEMVQAMQQLWTQRVTHFQGKYVNVGPCVFEPKPVQKPYPPVLFGGDNPVALKRAARLGNGWMGTTHTPDEMREIIATLKRHLAEYGRERDPFEISVMARTVDRDIVRRYEEVGVHRLLVFPPSSVKHPPPQEFMDGLERMAERVIR